MVIVDEHDAIHRPSLRAHANMTKLVDDRRRFLIFFYGLFAALMAAGLALCLWLWDIGEEPMVAGALYFGFVGGIMGYITLRYVARSQACWFYPEERLIQVRRTWFGVSLKRAWIDAAGGVLAAEPARLRGTRITKNPFAWVLFVALLPLGFLGWLLGCAMEHQVLLEADALCVRDARGQVRLVTVLSSRGDIASQVVALFESGQR